MSASMRRWPAKQAADAGIIPVGASASRCCRIPTKAANLSWAQDIEIGPVIAWKFGEALDMIGDVG